MGAAHRGEADQARKLGMRNGRVSAFEVFDALLIHHYGVFIPESRSFFTGKKRLLSLLFGAYQVSRARRAPWATAGDRPRNAPAWVCLFPIRSGEQRRSGVEF